MSYKCSICGKGSKAGKSVSHSHRASNRLFKPNLQRQRIMVNGKITRTYVCSNCLKSGRIVKVV
ncbi:MAG: 50S ribosomal protein L28 [Endomicrobiales bacterium]|nr:50S ribosomal protein L28 [Endomicrobiales bacterium]